MADRNRLQNYYERDKSYSRDRLQKHYDKNKSCRRDRSPRYYKNNYEREYYTFQDHRNRRKYKESYKDKYREENHKYKRRSRDYYEDVYEDRYNRDEYEHQYIDESYNLGRDRSRERQHECNARITPYFSKLELVDSTIRKLDPRKVITERFIKAVSDDIDYLFDSTCSLAEVRCWLAKKYIQVKDQKAENENSTVDPHVNITGNGSPQNYEFKNAELEVTPEAVDTEIIEISDSDSEEEMQNLDLCECEIIDELDFRELEQILQVMIKLTEG